MAADLREAVVLHDDRHHVLVVSGRRGARYTGARRPPDARAARLRACTRRRPRRRRRRLRSTDATTGSDPNVASPRLCFAAMADSSHRRERPSPAGRPLTDSRPRSASSRARRRSSAGRGGRRHRLHEGELDGRAARDVQPLRRRARASADGRHGHDDRLVHRPSGRGRRAGLAACDDPPGGVLGGRLADARAPAARRPSRPRRRPRVRPPVPAARGPTRRPTRTRPGCAIPSWSRWCVDQPSLVFDLENNVDTGDSLVVAAAGDDMDEAVLDALAEQARWLAAWFETAPHRPPG